tara:strand:- start:3541 stop:4398 length:858 start_codon:yes stop_codon:yes gene_type:complete
MSEEKIEISNVALKRLLELTQRPQFVNGKVVNQVDSCMLHQKLSVVYTECLVRDGRTSLSKFTVNASNETKTPIKIPICDIPRVLGVLVYHGTKLTLTYSDDKLKIKSPKKQTTLAGGLNAKAFPHSNETITTWDKKSSELGAKISIAGRDVTAGYVLKDGTVKDPSVWFTVESNDMFEALRCNNVNGQKLNRYTFKKNIFKYLSISVGDELLGKTTTDVDIRTSSGWNFNLDVEFEGGLENVFKHYEGVVTLNFFDFTKQNQGWRLIIRLGDLFSYVYQASVIQ